MRNLSAFNLAGNNFQGRCLSGSALSPPLPSSIWRGNRGNLTLHPSLARSRCPFRHGPLPVPPAHVPSACPPHPVSSCSPFCQRYCPEVCRRHPPPSPPPPPRPPPPAPPPAPLSNHPAPSPRRSGGHCGSRSGCVPWLLWPPLSWSLFPARGTSRRTGPGGDEDDDRDHGGRDESQGSRGHAGDYSLRVRLLRQEEGPGPGGASLGRSESRDSVSSSGSGAQASAKAWATEGGQARAALGAGAWPFASALIRESTRKGYCLPRSACWCGHSDPQASARAQAQRDARREIRSPPASCTATCSPCSASASPRKAFLVYELPFPRTAPSGRPGHRGAGPGLGGPPRHRPGAGPVPGPGSTTRCPALRTATFKFPQRAPFRHPGPGSCSPLGCTSHLLSATSNRWELRAWVPLPARIPACVVSPRRLLPLQLAGLGRGLGFQCFLSSRVSDSRVCGTAGSARAGSEVGMGMAGEGCGPLRGA